MLSINFTQCKHSAVELFYEQKYIVRKKDPYKSKESDRK